MALMPMLRATVTRLEGLGGDLELYPLLQVLSSQTVENIPCKMIKR